MSKLSWIGCAACALLTTSVLAQEGPSPSPAPSRVEVYKTVGDATLRLNVFTPPDWKPGDRRPAIVFFFGGGWSGGSTKQFTPQARYLASRGMVAITAEYRIHSLHQSQIADSVADAKSAIRWVRAHAEQLGIDPNRIASAGGSAGGHLAASVGTLTGFDEPGEDTSVSCRSNAMLLFNPVVDLTPEGMQRDRESDWFQNISKRAGGDLKDLSPGLHIEQGTPPTIIFHGRADTTVPYAQVERFAETMTKAGNRCELVGFDDEGHAFFNYGRRENKSFFVTLKAADDFLVSLGYLEGPGNVDQFFGKTPSDEDRK